MAERSVNAVVIRRRDSGESDRRLTLLTSELGKIDVVAKGARKGGSRLAGSSDVLTMAQMSLAEGKRNLFVTQVQPLASFRGLRTDYERLSLALALAELFAVVLPYEEPSPETFDLFVTCLRALENHPKPVVAMVWCELQLMHESGFLPQFDICSVTGQRVQEANPFLSPMAGGYVVEREAIRHTDRVRTRAEVLYGLARTAELGSPPENLKFAPECLIALFPFWRHIAEAQLPANESVVSELRADQVAGEGKT